MKRRDFVRTGILATSGVIFMDPLAGCSYQKGKYTLPEEYHKSFQNPPATSRLFVRWWWNGNRLTEKEILRELDVMKAAGIGGVEINPIAFPREADPAGYESLTMFSDQWLDMLKTALDGAKERGIICDMIVGSGWPFGGEFLEKDDQTQVVTIETIDLVGGRNYNFSVQELLEKADPEIHSRNTRVYRDLLMARLVPATMVDFTEGTDLMDNIEGDSLSLDVPAGKHVLYCVVKLTGYMAVINGAPGAAGPVLNHYSRPAVENYLNRISDLITGRIGNMGDSVRAMFCDSMELEGANWNDDLPSEFEKRRGYSLLPWLPFVLKKVGHMGNPVESEYGTKFSDGVAESIRRVSLDFYKTRIELFRERFIGTFNEWCHRNNVLSRMQAYGRGMHPLEASMEIDIPECETWLFREVGREYPATGLKGRAALMCNKYVASGAALSGKKEVSCEEVTNTSMAFMATLENIKVAGDQSNISGVNHSILHGFNYSPPEAPFPGWVRYGTWFNERNTWWPWFPLWSAYKARISCLLQNATPRANVAILQPLTDLWLKIGPQRDPFPQKWYPEYQNNLWEAVHQNGGGCDYVSENIITKATCEKGRMSFNGRSWHTLLLPGIETLPMDAVRALETFAAAGGKIVFIGNAPFKSASFKNPQEHDEEVKQSIEILMNNHKENVILYPAPEGEVIQWYGKLQEELGISPYLKIDKPHTYLNQSSYLLGNNPVFFIANTGLSEHIAVKAEFQVESGLHPWVWDPETGKKFSYPLTGNGNSLLLELPRATSLLLVFEEEEEGEKYHPELQQTGGEEITGPWQLELSHIDGSRQETELESLKNLTELLLAKNFAGTVTYRKTIRSGDFSFIDLGNVQGVAEIRLNGRLLGTKWYGAYTFDIKDAVRTGENELMVKVTTITGNYLKSLQDNPVAQAWTVNQQPYPMGMLGPVRIS